MKIYVIKYLMNCKMLFRYQQYCYSYYLWLYSEEKIVE